MLDLEVIARAVELQKRSYELLKWMTDAVDRGFITFRAAHQYASLTEATTAWIDRHYNDLPRAARPERADVPAFANLFTTYLDTSFDLVETPRKRLFSPDAHCFCPLCSWMVEMPRLQTKAVSRSDKKRAHKLRIAGVKQVALDVGRPLSDENAETLVVDSLLEASSLVAYGYDLLRRLDGVAQGAATLALWRGFAWTREGSPKKKFNFSAALITAGEANVASRVLACAI